MPAKASLKAGLRRHFRTSTRLNWAHPNSLKSDALKRELTVRNLPVSSDREANISVLCQAVGDFDPSSGLTTDVNLIKAKRIAEESARNIPSRTGFSCEILMESRHYKQFRSTLPSSEEDIVSVAEQPYRVKLNGRYGDVLRIRNKFLECQEDIVSEENEETIYVIPKFLAPKLMEGVRLSKEIDKKSKLQTVDDSAKYWPMKMDASSVLLSMKQQSEAKYHLYKLKSTDTYLLVIQGPKSKRMVASKLLENTFREDLSLTENRQHKKASRRKKSASLIDDIVYPRDELSISLYLDPSIRDLVIYHPSFLSDIADQTNTTIKTNLDDPAQYRPFEVFISGEAESVEAARSKVDDIACQFRKQTTCLFLNKKVFNTLQPVWRSLCEHLSDELGVSVMTSRENGDVIVHLTGAPAQRERAMQTIDYHIFKQSYVDSMTRQASLVSRRQRIRNIHFSDWGIGGLQDELKVILRRTFASRCISEQLRKEMGVKHTKGVLLYGPPGTGKSLIARKISGILGCENPKIINAPEVESKWVGEAEKNIRNLFEEAQKEFLEKGSESNLHVIIFDELDAIAKRRGGAHAKSRDGALNQMLCSIDGINEIDNILIFGLTNRFDALDPALLRPGRLEVHIEIGLPDEKGREDILNIHTKAMRNYQRLNQDVDISCLAAFSEGFSGADLAGFVRNAQAFALEEFEEEDQCQVTMEHLERALEECRIAKLKQPPVKEEKEEPGLMIA